MGKLVIKRAAEASSLKVQIPDHILGQLSQIAVKANTSVHEVVTRCLTHALRDLRVEDDQATGQRAH